MTDHAVVTHEDWIAARKTLLVKEKEFSRLRDELRRQRRELPWEKVEKDYVFEGPDGNESLLDLFDGRSQLIVYHFMFDPDWEEGCKSCSFLADHYDPAVVHLQQRDTNLVTVSRAPLDKLQAFKKRMGWRFKWVSSLGNDFNWDYYVSFKRDHPEQEVFYNYGMQRFPMTEAPGISVFMKDEMGAVFHSYSSYARGLDMFLGTYHLLDIVPKGRDEDGLSYTMEWLRHHDRYG
jgi:predicted dithiol-disulfide oxidoreductase (DUF899 family)